MAVLMAAPGQFSVLSIAAAAALAAYVLQPLHPAPQVAQPAADVHTAASGAAEPIAPLGNGLAAFTIKRAPDSHFYADAQINGTIVRFLVDTGAAAVVLTPQDALNAGIGGGDYSASGLGAGGRIALMPATAQRLALGPLAADNVPVMVARDALPVSLLGQSYLSRVGSVSIEGDTMTLR